MGCTILQSTHSTDVVYENFHLMTACLTFKNKSYQILHADHPGPTRILKGHFLQVDKHTRYNFCEKCFSIIGN